MKSMGTETLSRSDELAAVRSHLANERTLLAYVRTSLGFVATGLAVLGFVRVEMPAATGWVLIGFGAAVLAVGVGRFMHVRRKIAAPFV